MTDIASINRDTLPDPGDPPVLDWIDKTLIDVDPLYQRPLDATRADGIAKAFTWRSFGALVVVPAADGRYHVADGQHRLAAAKAHPKVQHVPAVIVQADDKKTEVGVFVSVNRDRKHVSALELFFASLVAEEPKAVKMLELCQRAGLRVPKHPGNFKPCDTVAVVQIAALVDGYSDDRVLEFLTIAAAGKFAPVTAAQIRAVEHILMHPEFRGQIQADDLRAFLAATGRTLDSEAKRFSATHNVPFWKGLANIWFQKCKKRRTASAPPVERRPAMTAVANLVAASAVKHRTIVPHAPVSGQRNVTAAVAGDPPPGRSALDQRRAG